jgi:hypothetical protein
MGLAVLLLWGRPLLYLPPRLSAPFSKLLAFPHAAAAGVPAGSVTVLPWLALCDRAAAALAGPLLPRRGAAAAAAPGAGAARDAKDR